MKDHTKEVLNTIEGAAPEASPAGEAAEAATKNKARRGSVLIAVCAIVLVACIVGLAAFSLPVQAQPQHPDANEPAPSGSSNVSVTVSVKDSAGIATRTTVLIKDANADVVLECTDVPTGTTLLTTLPKGSYTLYVTATPVCLDGSSFSEAGPYPFDAPGDGGTVDVQVSLEKVSASGMTAAQLAASAAALDNAGYADAAAAIRHQQGIAQPASTGQASGHEAPTDSQGTDQNGSNSSTGSTSSTSQGQGSSQDQAGNGNGSNGGSSSGTGTGGTSSNGGGSTGSGSSNGGGGHSPVWVVDSPAWDEWVVDVPGRPEVQEQGHYVAVWYSGGVTFYDYDSARAYSFDNKTSISTSSIWVVDVPYQPAVPEQGHWVHHDATGHWE